MRRRSGLIGLCLVALVLAACGLKGDPETPEPEPEPPAIGA